ncbi:helix-turn-helix domain-containing protein [Micromonospora andamanensis]|uniref:HTH cro/C1-type domain-containing protein n=1 Tax=Micromonospora andamanensis TaxID=1287068 RepID=A0ABQ4I258_9ACTN|nr:helix-turn-helix transcriptional regulator [Micromonospora andamanensis]GIJ11936.1 hypothetical protein Van01_51500 [Micromonospora andamanensis]GIJ42167.1 hypothetical protein Vwe01_54920 [Micromonospora andamanensis]
MPITNDDRRPANFGALLRSLRLQTRFTQEDLAEKSTLSVRAIVDLECGRVVRPRQRTVELLAGALGLNAAQQAAFAEMASRDYWTNRLYRECATQSNLKLPHES